MRHAELFPNQLLQSTRSLSESSLIFDWTARVRCGSHGAWLKHSYPGTSIRWSCSLRRFRSVPAGHLAHVVRDLVRESEDLHRRPWVSAL